MVILQSDGPGRARALRHEAAASAAGALVVRLAQSEIAGSLEALDGADLVLIPCMAWGADLQRLLEGAAAREVRVICDMDDRAPLSGSAPEPAVIGADLCFAATQEAADAVRALHKPAIVVPNGFDDVALEASRLAVRARAAATPDGLVRIGCAGFAGPGAPEFGSVAQAVVDVLAARPHCRLVLHKVPVLGVDIWQFPGLPARLDQIEWRDPVPDVQGADELARLDILLVPAAPGDPPDGPRSETPFVLAALAGVCTVASATGPIVRAVRDGDTGVLVRAQADWPAALLRLVDDAALRQAIARAAFLSVLYNWGPHARVDAMWSILRQMEGGRAAARAFALDIRTMPAPSPEVPLADTMFRIDRGGIAAVTVVIPVYNYAEYVSEALDSAARQSLVPLDLVVVDDCSTDGSLAVVLDWARRHAERFNRLLVLRIPENAGLGPARNAGFAAAETPYVLPLDADNRLRDECGAACLAVLQRSGAAFAYPRIQCFGLSDEVIGAAPFLAARLAGGNYIDAMALVGKWAWAAIGGYRSQRLGWEDYDFWCRLVERGLWGEAVETILADYRVHGDSMLRKLTDLQENKRHLVSEMRRLHSWVSIAQP